MSSASKIILEYVCPGLGVITANAMFFAPVRAVQQASRRGTLGDLNPTPWAMMTGNCCGWVMYSYVIQNYFVFFGNAPGFMISVWLNMCAAKLQYQGHCAKEMRKSFVQFVSENRASFRISNVTGDAAGGGTENDETEATSLQQQRGLTDIGKMVLQVSTQEIHAPAPHERIVVGVVLVWLAVTTLVCFLKISQQTREMIVGLVVNCNLVFFYGAPLSTIFTVLKTRNSASIHIWSMITSTCNGVFWSSFGWAVWDLYIAIPNGLGALLGAIQMFLVITVPRKSATQSSLDHEEKEMESEIELESQQTAVVRPERSSSQEESYSNENNSAGAKGRADKGYDSS